MVLAQAGQRVLVLEQHEVPGGWCHSFTLEGYRYSPGVHYIGELGPGESVRAMLEALDVGDDLAFSELNPDGYDHVIIGRPGEQAGASLFVLTSPRVRMNIRRASWPSFPPSGRALPATLICCASLPSELRRAPWPLRT